MTQKENQHGHHEDHHGDHCGKAVFIKIATTSGIWPSQADHYMRFSKSTPVIDAMKAAAKELGISDIADWVAETEDKQLVTADSFGKNHIHCDTIIDMHPAAGGGGQK